MNRWQRLAAVAAAMAVSTTGGIAWASQSGVSAPKAGPKALGGGLTEAKSISISPCRIADTRKVDPVAKVPANVVRPVKVRGIGVDLSAQGGNTAGCGIPATATAIEVTITGTEPSGKGFLRAFPDTDTGATFLNYSPALYATNTGMLDLCDSCAHSGFSYELHGAQSHVVVDVTGYYVAPMAVGVSADGSVTDATNARVKEVTHLGEGNYNVDFDRDVDLCLPAVQSYDRTIVAVAGVSATGINVQTWAPAAQPGEPMEPADTAFSLQVTC